MDRGLDVILTNELHHQLAVAQIARVERPPFYRRLIARAQIVEGDGQIAGAIERLAGLGPNEPSTACHEDRRSISHDRLHRLGQDGRSKASYRKAGAVETGLNPWQTVRRYGEDAPITAR